MHNYQKTRTAHVVRKIHSLFQEHKSKRGRQPLMEAKWFLAQLPGSPVTIAKAKKALGITSKKVAGRFCWFFPKIHGQSPEDRLREVLDKLSHGSRSNIYRVPIDHTQTQIKGYAEVLKEIFRANRYHMTARQAVAEMKKARHQSTKYIYPAKKLIQVKTFIGEDGQWNWVWAGVEVEDWLIDFLRRGPVLQDTVFKAAERMGWSSQVIYDARTNAGAITTKKLNGKKYWVDANSFSASDEINDTTEQPLKPSINIGQERARPVKKVEIESLEEIIL